MRRKKKSKTDWAKSTIKRCRQRTKPNQPTGKKPPTAGRNAQKNAGEPLADGAALSPSPSMCQLADSGPPSNPPRMRNSPMCVAPSGVNERWLKYVDKTSTVLKNLFNLSYTGS